MKSRILTSAASLAVAFIVMLYPLEAAAHCDTMNGPVVAAAKLALARGDITPVLKWIKPDAEAEIRAAFKQALVVRKSGAEARDLADRYFFETLVRVHRAGEGAPYTGLKAADSPVAPAILRADQALEGQTSIEAVISLLNGGIADGVRQRYERVMEASKHVNDSVEAGRHFVEAYVEYVHYVEKIHLAVSGNAAEHAEAEARAPKAQQHK